MSGASKKEVSSVSPEEELETLAGDGNDNVVELYDGSKVTVSKCKLRHASKVARCVNVVLIGLGVDSMDGVDRLAVDNPQVILNTLDIAEDSLIDAIEALTDIDREQVLDLDADDAIAVLIKIFEVNRDFFLKRVSKVLSGFLASAENQKGQGSS